MNGMRLTVGPLILSVACILGSYALVDYSNLEATGASCPGRDNCVLIGRANFTQRNCECDRLCSSYGDCCIDASASGTSERNRNPPLHCMAFGPERNVGVYAVDSCSRNYVGPAAVRNKCETQDDLDDPLVSVPVTKSTRGVTYRNRYCAECNNVNPNLLKSWLIFLNCETLAPFGLNHSFVWQNIKYMSNMSTWGVQFRGEFHMCEVVFDRPTYISSGVRLCRPHIVSTCPQSWQRVSVSRLCEAYTGVVFTRSDVVYKNTHCALCNGELVGDLYCDIDGILSRRKKPFSFALLLDVNTSDGNIVGESHVCPSGEKYDPFFKKCRKLVCALPGYTMANGKCKKN